MKSLKISLILLTMFSVLPALCQNAAVTSSSDKTWTLKAKYQLNDLLVYKMIMNMKMSMAKPDGTALPMGSSESTASATIRMKTISVKPDGSAVITSSTSNGIVKTGGKSMPMPKTPVITMDIAPNGIAKMHGMDNIPGAQFMSGSIPTMGIMCPDHPVKVGDEWENKIPNPLGGEDVTVNSQLLAVETIKGQETLKIKQAMTMPLEMKMGKDGKKADSEKAAMMTMHGDVTSTGINNIIPENGRLVRSEGTFTSEIQMQMTGDAAAKSPFGSDMKMTQSGTIIMDMISAGKATSPAAHKSTATKKKKK